MRSAKYAGYLVDALTQLATEQADPKGGIVKKMRLRSVAGTLGMAMVTSLMIVPAATVAQADPGVVPAPTAHYDMTHSGTQLTDVSGNDRHATLTSLADSNFIVSGGHDLLKFDGKGYASLPQGLVTGTDNDFTVEMTTAAPARADQFAWVIGNGVGDWNTPGLGNYVFMNPSSRENGQVFGGIRVFENPGNGEARIPWAGALQPGLFSTVTIVSEDDTLTVFVNGEKKTSTSHTKSMSKIVPTGDVLGYLGRSLYNGDGLFQGLVADVKFWDETLTADEVAQSAPAELERREMFAEILQDEIATKYLGANASADAVTTNLGLPTSVSGVSLTWTSSNPAVIASNGKVTRQAGKDVPVTVTATDSFGITYSFDVVVLQITQDEFEENFAADFAAVTVADSTHENLPLVSTGANGSAVTWASSNAAIITGTDATYQPGAVGAADPFKGAGKVTRPAYGTGDASVTLTATVTMGELSKTKTFEVTVEELGRVSPDKGYVAAYFKADNDEKIYQAHTTGNDFFTFTESNGGKPAVEAFTDTTGLRDPYILRSVNGDRYYMVATDLCIGCTGDWGGAQRWGSLKINVYESVDLVNWTRTNAPEDTGIVVNQPRAGMTWAPEVYWDDALESYVVHFASRLYTDDEHITTDGGGHAQMFYVLTRDFKTFTEPVSWQNTGHARIDSTIMKIDDYFYRFTKNEDGGGADGLERGKDIFLERSKVLTSQTFKSDPNGDPETTWELMDTAMSTPKTGHAGEGPQIVKLNEGDPSNPTGDGYVFLVDNYGDGGYVPFLTTGAEISASSWENRLSKQSDWKNLPKTGLPKSPRHGAFVNVPQNVLDAVSTWSDIKQVATTTEATLSGRTVTATVGADDHGDVVGTVTFTLGDWTQTVALSDKTASVEVPAGLAGTVTATYDGYRDGALATSSGTVAITDGETPVDPTVDTAALEAGIAAAKKLVADEYTADSWAGVTAALADAQAVLGNKDATQDEVDAAAAALDLAVKALVKVPGPIDPTDPTDPTKPGDGKPGDDKDDTDVTGKPGASDDDLAQTGANVTGAILALFVLGLGGIGVLLAARKRA